MSCLSAIPLYFATAIAEIVSCYRPMPWLVDGIRPTLLDLSGAAVVLAGMAIIVFAPRT